METLNYDMAKKFWVKYPYIKKKLNRLKELRKQQDILLEKMERALEHRAEECKKLLGLPRSRW